MKGRAVLRPKRSNVRPKQKGKSSLPRVIYHSRFGDLPLAPRKIVRILPPLLFQDPSLAARNGDFDRALRKIGALRKPRPAPVVKPPAGPTSEEAEHARTDCAPAPGPVAEPNEDAERRGTEPVEDVSNNTLEDAPREGHKSRQQRRKRKTFQRTPARQFLTELLTQGKVRESMRPNQICQVFQKSWPKNKREISDTTVGRAWKDLLEDRENSPQKAPVKSRSRKEL